MKNKINENNFISRFSSSVIGNGKKVCGHKIFLQSLFISRQLQRKNSIQDKSFFNFLTRIGFSLQRLQEFVKSGKKSYLREQDYNDYIKLEKNVMMTTNLKTLKSETCSKNKTKSDKKKHIKVDACNILEKVKNKVVSKSSSSLVRETLYNNDNKAENKAKIQQENALLENKVLQTTNKAFFDNSICNVKPVLETRKVRKGRITYRVPLVTQTERQEGKAISWIVKSAWNTKAKKERKENHFSISSKSFEQEKKNYRCIETCLAQQFIDAFNKKGESFDKKKESHKIALQNRAYVHYRWW